MSTQLNNKLVCEKIHAISHGFLCELDNIMYENYSDNMESSSEIDIIKNLELYIENSVRESIDKLQFVRSEDKVDVDADVNPIIMTSKINENIDQALYHCSKIDRFYDCNAHLIRDEIASSPSKLSLSFIMSEHENLKRQLNIIKEKCK